MLRELSRFGNAPGRADCLKPLLNHANSLADGVTPPLTYSRRQLILANAPSAPQISLPSPSGHTALLLRFFWPNITSRTRILHLQLGDCIQRNFVLLAVKCHGISLLSTANWGSDVELEAMESEQTGLAFSLPSTCACLFGS